MDDTRAEMRRRAWQGGTTAAVDKGRFERDFWKGTTAAERLAAIWEMAVSWAKQTGGHGTTPRLDRTIGGVRRRAG